MRYFEYDPEAYDGTEVILIEQLENETIIYLQYPYSKEIHGICIDGNISKVFDATVSEEDKKKILAEQSNKSTLKRIK